MFFYKFKDYLQYSKSNVLTDSNPLSYILKKINVDDVSQRWEAELSEFDLELVHRTGKSNTAADSLSRLTEPSHDDTSLKAWCESNTRCARVVKAVLDGVGNTDYQSEHMLLLDIHNDQNIDHVLDKAMFLVGSNKEFSWSHIEAEDSGIQFDIKHFVDRTVKTFQERFY